MYYKRICCGLSDSGTLVPETDSTHIFCTQDRDYYESLFLYNEKQYEEFLETRTVAGVTDVVADHLYFDFDSKDNLVLAQSEASDFVQNLGMHCEITFSGKKGFGVKVPLDNTLISVSDFKHAVFKLADKYSTFDRVVNNPSRIIRFVNTKHQDSGLYKIQLAPEELKDEPISNILEWAKKPCETWSTEENEFPASLKAPVEEPKVKVTKEFPSLDLTNKPKELSNCRWALQNGFFKEGQRSTALLALASYYKNKGFDQEIVYRMLKGVAEIQANRTETERFPDSEVYNNIIVQVFSDTWKNGQYSCREPGNFLFDYCKNLGPHKCNHVADDAMKPKTMDSVHAQFKDFVNHIEENTVLTGIKAIDENFFLSTGSNVLVLGAAASGKTALALNILNNTSKNGVKSVFASLDMHRNRMFEKVMYKISGLPRDELYHKFQMDQEGPLMNKLKEEFGNVYFFNKSCPTVQDVRDYVIACQESSGERIKLVMVDYFERVTSDMSDDTASSKRVAGELQDMVNDLDICLITLVQPNKASIFGGPDKPIYNYTAIKGSSFVYQAARQILSIYRPFATPELKEHDKYMGMSILKNDLGEQGDFVFGWNGKRGEIRELEDHEFNDFEELLEKKNREEKEEGGF